MRAPVSPATEIVQALKPMSEDLIDRLIKDWARERPDLDADAMAIVGRVIRAGRILEERAGKALKPFGLSYTDFDVIATLRRSGPPFQLAPKALSAAVLLTSGAMTAALGRLERARLIERARDEDDARIIWVKLTSRGARLADRAVEARFAEAASAVDGVSRAGRRELADSLRQLILRLKG